MGPSTGAIGSLPDTRMRHTEVRARLLEAARYLMWEAGGPSFTVTQVVAASGASLKSFYRCFSSKDELLVALFEDDARRGARRAGRHGRRRGRALERLRPWWSGCSASSPSTADSRMPPRWCGSTCAWPSRIPTELRAVLHPFVAVFADVLRDAQARGAVRPGDPRRDARTLFHLVVSHLHALICHQIDEPPDEVAEELWAFCAALRRDHHAHTEP